MNSFVVFIIGFVLGGGIVYIILSMEKRARSNVAGDLYEKLLTEKNREIELLLKQLREVFGALSNEALSRNSHDFLRIANVKLNEQIQSGEKDLEHKKKNIDGSISDMRSELDQMRRLIIELEKDRVHKFGQLSQQLKASVEQTTQLQSTTEQLKNALTNTKIRGQWGERMAEDVLQLAGFVEGINYFKQKSLASNNKRPDFTFMLPQSLILNMDVKFPLDNYLRFLNASTEQEQKQHKEQFLKDVKARIKEVTTKDYINPDENTVDYVLIFIPNEQVYSFINQEGQEILEEALRNKVIISSPFTLYAILSIVRQAIDNFQLEQTASQILSLMGSFKKQWEKFTMSMEKMGKKIDEAKTEYSYLLSTRKNQLEKPLEKIEALRQSKGLEAAKESPTLEA
ncbi:DNA recombination protein RmuC [Rapidithrix thailandica]|uniref:DNA recombination protein RmuC n=1 Tax=Rapidithrix thailandica TaxID=413964 RepID=A0AAW9RT60_9BACT